MAKPRKLASGRWMIQVYLGRTPEGKPINKTLTADSVYQDYIDSEVEEKRCVGYIICGQVIAGSMTQMDVAGNE